ncbi:MAG: plasmid pRiA4b ORF-3 family protein [Anaerovibrio sp.]
MVYTLKVYPKGWGRKAYRVIKISGSATLNSLCEVILDSFDFSDEHMYEFCMDNKMYSRDSYQSDPDPGERSAKIKIDKLGLKEKQKFSLHYDFGDDWMFVINVQKIQEEAGKCKPCVIKSKGKVEQYPDFEDYWGYKCDDECEDEYEDGGDEDWEDGEDELDEETKKIIDRLFREKSR